MLATPISKLADLLKGREPLKLNLCFRKEGSGYQCLFHLRKWSSLSFGCIYSLYLHVYRWFELQQHVQLSFSGLQWWFSVGWLIWISLWICPIMCQQLRLLFSFAYFPTKNRNSNNIFVVFFWLDPVHCKNKCLNLWSCVRLNIHYCTVKGTVTRKYPVCVWNKCVRVCVCVGGWGL